MKTCLEIGLETSFKNERIETNVRFVSSSHALKKILHPGEFSSNQCQQRGFDRETVVLSLGAEK